MCEYISSNFIEPNDFCNFLGRKPKFPKEKKTEIFEAEEENLVKNNKIPLPRSSIWETLKSQYNLRADVTPKAIYTAALEFYKAKGVLQSQTYSECENSDVSNKSNELNESNGSNKSNESHQSDCNPKNAEHNLIRFKILLSAKAWNYIRPEHEEYHRNPDTSHKSAFRKYYVLKRGSWTCALAEQIAKKRNDIPCRWIFKRGKVYNDGECYIKVSGQCITCDANLIGILKQKPETPTKSIIFEFEIQGFDLTKHSHQKKQKSVRLGGDFAHDIYEAPGTAIMKSRNALKEATTLCEYPVGRVPTNKAISSGKYRLRKFHRLNDCPIKATQLLKLSHFGSCIRSIGYNPFHALYVSTDQIVMYNIYKKKNTSSIVSCDATGGIAHKIGINILYFFSITSENCIILTYLISNLQFAKAATCLKEFFCTR